jgi:hypothetical protein
MMSRATEVHEPTMAALDEYLKDSPGRGGTRDPSSTSC